MKYGMGVFKEGIIIDDDLHIDRSSQLLTQMRGCSIFLNHNMWFRVEKIKTEEELLEYLINHKNSKSKVGE